MNLKFCPYCAGRLEWRRREDERLPQPVCTQCGQVLWQNPKPTVSALLVHGDGVANPYEVLLVRRARPPQEGCWDCPGGFIDPDETPEAALQRELHEELSLEPSRLTFLGVYMDRYGPGGESTLNLCYWGSIRSGTPSPGSDVSAAEWFRLDRLPKSLAFDNNRQALAALRLLLHPPIKRRKKRAK